MVGKGSAATCRDGSTVDPTLARQNASVLLSQFAEHLLDPDEPVGARQSVAVDRELFDRPLTTQNVVARARFGGADSTRGPD
jgi:hypothetical protein